MQQVLIPRSELAYTLSLSETRVAELVRNGTLPQPLGRGKFDLHASVRAYLSFLRSQTKGTLAEEKTRLTKLKADREELELKLKSGAYVSAELLRQWLFVLVRTCRDNLLVIPDRMAGILAAECDPGEVHTALSKEITQILHELADGLERIPGVKEAGPE